MKSACYFVRLPARSFKSNGSAAHTLLIGAACTLYWSFAGLAIAEPSGLERAAARCAETFPGDDNAQQRCIVEKADQIAIVNDTVAVAFPSLMQRCRAAHPNSPFAQADCAMAAMKGVGDALKSSSSTSSP